MFLFNLKNIFTLRNRISMFGQKGKAFSSNILNNHNEITIVAQPQQLSTTDLLVKICVQKCE